MEFQKLGRFKEGETPLGVYDQTNEDYHSSDGISKSGLFTLWSKTPRHFAEGVREEKKHFTLGSAAHTAILEPHLFEATYLRGTEDRRGKKWDETLLIAAETQRIALTAKDYDAALFIRDSAHRNDLVRLIVKDAIVEKSAYARHADTGMTVRCKPDAYSPGLQIIGDIKTAANASAEKFAKSVFEYGYNVQEAMYSPIWREASGLAVEGFVFFVIESKHPYMVVPYELDRGAFQEGAAIYEMAMERYAQCVRSGQWPGYPEDVQQLDIPRWAYRHTKQPEPEPAHLAGLEDDVEENG